MCNIVKQIRLQLGLTQAAMARMMGVHYHLWIKWERQEQRITASPLRHLQLLQRIKKDIPNYFDQLVKDFSEPDNETQNKL